jgi:hypothetical protein
MLMKRVPLWGRFTTRETSLAKDQKFKNCFPVKINTNATEGGGNSVESYIVKRPGLGTHADTSTVAAGRGIHGWSQDGKLYSVIGNKLFANTTDINSGGRFNNTTGIARFSETRASTPLLVIQDGNDLWTVAADGTVTEVTDAHFPSAIVGGVAHLETYTFVMTPDGAIYHSEVNDPSSWVATSFLTCQIGSDKGVGIASHKNYIVGFGEWTTEFFFNAGNASGSVLSPVDGAVVNWGCAEGNTIATAGDTVVWLGQSINGGKAVMMLDGLSPKIISTRSIERQLEKEADLSDCYAYCLHLGGHIHYCLTLKTAAITLVFDLRDEVWWQMTSDVSGTETYFTGVDSTTLDNVTYVLDEDNGKIYDFSIDNYRDVAETIKVEIVTNPIDFNMRGRKFIHRLSITGDQAASTDNLVVDWSDDNYQNFSTSRTLDMSKNDPRLTVLGSFTRGRAFRIKHTANLPMRLGSLEFGITGGDYSV